jgi:formylglycine-generating enzyme required for sulfatase activity
LPEGYVYRLPTEAEWEYACRAGTTTVFFYGDEMRSGLANFNATEEYSLIEGGVAANPSGVFLERTTPVGSYAPNAWGVYDMHGNVRERCYDGVDQYPSGPVTDPVVRPQPDWVVIERGGSWLGSVIGLRSAHRDFHYPDFRHSAYGFRIVLAHPIE